MDFIQELKNTYFKHKYPNFYPINDINGIKTIYIHINKTGGTSINKVLNKKKMHLTSKEIISIVGNDRFKSSFKFTVIRNPFARCVSQYLHRVKTNQCLMKDEPISFGIWIRKVYGEERDNYYFNKQYKMFYTQVDWLKNVEEEIKIDLFLRFEALNSDYSKFAQDIGISNNLPHLNKSLEQPVCYKEFYNSETRRIVQNYFKEDLEIFKYKY